MGEIYENTIMEVKNAFTPEFCREIVKRFDEDPRKAPGVLLRGVDKSVKDSIDLHTDESADMYMTKEIFRTFDEMIDKYVTHLRKCNTLFPFQDMKKCWTYPVIQKTEPGGHFAWHADSDIDKQNTRLMAVILYLNDVPEEHGGATEFNSGRKVQPEIGKFLFFPTDVMHVHRGAKLKAGSKYIITSFLLDENRYILTKEPVSRYPFSVS